MTTIVNDNKQCCSLPPVQAEYTPKGKHERFAGFDTYIVGPADAKQAIVYIFDIFAFSAQAKQGADLLASQGFRVVMPDFFKGTRIDASLFGTNSSEAAAKKQEFFAGAANPANGVTNLSTVVTQLRAAGASKVGAAGFCWGAKVAIQAKDVDAIGMAHPSMMTPTDAEGAVCPMCILPSQGEDKSIMAALGKSLESNKFKDQNVYKVFEDSVHGWAAARADLKDETQRARYTEAYEIFANFFKKTLV